MTLGEQILQDALALPFELGAHLLVVAGAAGDLRLLLLDGAVDGVEPRLLVEQQALRRSTLSFSISRSSLARVFSAIRVETSPWRLR